MSRTLANFMINMGVNNRALAPGLRRSQRMVQSTMARIATSVKQVFAGLGVTAVGVALFQGAKAAATFEDTMTRVRINADLLGQDGAAAFEKLTQKARDLGASTRFSATQAAEAMNMLALAGLDVNEVYDASEPLLNLATAASLELAEAAKVGTTQMKIWAMEANQIPRISDTLTAAQSKMRTTVSDLNEGMSIAGSLAKKVGMDFEELAATVGLMQERSDSASKAGVALSIAIQKLASPSKETKKILKEYGVELKNFVRESTGEVDTFAAMAALAEKGATGVEATTKLFGARGKEIIKIFDVERKFNGETLRGVEAVKALAQELRNSEGFAERAATAMKQTFIGRLLELKSALEEVAISFLGPMLDGIMAIMRPLTALARWLGRLNEQLGGFPSDILKVAAAFMFLSIAVPAIIAGVKTLAVAFGVLLLNPIGFTIITIGALVVGLLQLQKAIKANPDAKWVKTLKSSLVDLKIAALNVWEALKTGAQKALKAVLSAFGVTTEDLQFDWKQWLTITAENLTTWIRNITMNIKVMSQNLGLTWNIIKTGFALALVSMTMKIIEFVVEAKAQFAGMVAGISAMMMTIGSKMKTMGKAVAAALHAAWAALFHEDSFEKIGQAMSRAFKAEMSRMTDDNAMKKGAEAYNKAVERNRKSGVAGAALSLLGLGKDKLARDLKKLQGDLKGLVALEFEKENALPDKLIPPPRITPEGGGRGAPNLGAFGDQAAGFSLDAGRFGFDSFGKSIQDAILKSGDDKDQKRNSLLEAGNMKQDELLKETKKVTKAIKDGAGKPATLDD